MSRERASIFEETGDIDLTGFAPRSAPDAQAPAAQAIRAVAEAANFRSREAPVPKAAAVSTRVPRRYRTGRNIQLNLKASPETVQAFYAIADRQGWVLGQTLEQAIAALARELESSR